MALKSPEMIRVRVSSDFGALRKVQRRLNDFMWSTELSYGYVLASDQLRTRTDEWTHNVLSHITAEAWYPNAKGKEKYRDKVSTFLAHVTENTTFTYRAVITLFSSAFEDYLETKRSLIKPFGKVDTKTKWGPYLQSLCVPALNWEKQVRLRKPLKLLTVLKADLCRLLRNRIVHTPHVLPLSQDDAEAESWKRQLLKSLAASNWYPMTKEKEKEKELSRLNRTVGGKVNDAVRSFVGGAAHSVARSHSLHGKVVPIEFFYMLFTFTALDALAFEIEEALLGPRAPTDVEVFRDPLYVRRDDLIIT
jgi:hypothetical protein